MKLPGDEIAYRLAAWGLLVASGAALAAWLILDQATRSVGDTSEYLALMSFVVGFGAVGLILAQRRPDHLMGWLLLGFALSLATRLALEEAALWADGLGRVADSEVAVAGANVALAVGSVLLVTLLLVFPHGNVTSPRWRVALFVTWVVGAFAVLAAPFTPLSVTDDFSLAAPWNIDWAGSALFVVSLPIYAVGLAGMGRIALLAFRGTPTERHQIRWVAYVLGLTLVLLMVTPLFSNANVVASYVAAIGVPISIGVAVTRYRLYDIDRIVNRTFVYAIVAGVLAMVFGAATLLITQLLPTGDSGLEVAGATLAVAALFNPLRRSVQGFVDRRFNRTPYDPADVLDRFAGRLRNEVDPGAIAADLVQVIGSTLQPRATQVWLRNLGPTRTRSMHP